MSDLTFYPVRYTFNDPETGEVVKSGTVVSGREEDKALEIFKKQNPHILTAEIHKEV